MNFGAATIVLFGVLLCSNTSSAPPACGTKTPSPPLGSVTFSTTPFSSSPNSASPSVPPSPNVLVSAYSFS
ncbi:hypothetical protein F5X98DRAFT_338377 [Xylaria grammica]|nr:hypothetical protein F5X98DRAFT_338377 [Xylaria grammica]